MRICTHCNLQEIEDEYHFLNRCTKYLSERHALDLKLHELYPNTQNLQDNARLMYLLSAGTDVAKYVATYIHDAFCLRESVV